MPKLWDTTQRIAIHHYHPVDFSYQNSTPYLVTAGTGLPANATDVRPEGEPGPDECHQFDPVTETWAIVEDRRGVSLWRKDQPGDQVAVMQLQCGPIDSAYTTIAPGTPDDEWSDSLGAWETDLLAHKARAIAFLRPATKDAKARGLQAMGLDTELLDVIDNAKRKADRAGQPARGGSLELLRGQGMNDAQLAARVDSVLDDGHAVIESVTVSTETAKAAINAAETALEVTSLRDAAFSVIDGMYR